MPQVNLSPPLRNNHASPSGHSTNSGAMSTKRAAQHPPGPSTSRLTSSSSSSNTLALSKLGSFKRNKAQKPPALSSDSLPTVRSDWSSISNFAPATRGGPVESLKTPRTRPTQTIETPWMTWLRTVTSTETSKKRDIARADDDQTHEVEDEVLVGDQSWESPSDASVASSSSISPFPLDETAQPSTTLAASSFSLSTRRDFLLPPKPSFASQSREKHVNDLSLPSRPSSTLTLPSTMSKVSSNLELTPLGQVPVATSSSWGVLHVGGIEPSLSDRDIHRMVSRHSVPRPCAITIFRPNRRNEQSARALVAYESPKHLKEALKELKDGLRKEVNGGKIHVSRSKVAPNEIKWQESETIEHWGEMASQIDMKVRNAGVQGTVVNSRAGQGKSEEGKRRNLVTNQVLQSSVPSVRPIRMLPPPPPPPPPPYGPLDDKVPSQALLQALLGELRKSSPLDTNIQSCQSSLHPSP